MGFAMITRIRPKQNTDQSEPQRGPLPIPFPAVNEDLYSGSGQHVSPIGVRMSAWA